MSRTMLIYAFVALMATSAAVGAGGDKGDFELGVFAGAGFLDDYGPGTLQLNPDDDNLFGARAGWFFTEKGSVELSYQRLQSDALFDPSLALAPMDFDVDAIRANILHNFRAGKSVRPFVTAGLGHESTEVEGILDDDDLTMNAGFGLRWFVTRTFGLRFDGRWNFVDVSSFVDSQQSNFEGTFGLTWAFGGQEPTDSDGDGVFDSKDRCPDTPRGAKVDARGCPLDGDGDGVFDGIDKCPDTASGVPVDATGCPRDSDGDGVHDGKDKCPKTPRGAKVDSTGCPKDSDGDGVFDGIDKCADTLRGAKVDASGCPKDSDGDGVFDGIDKCPGTPRGAKVDASGCPKDSDGDGVFDGIDKCPGTPRGTKVDEKGCKQLFEEEARTLVLEGVNFEFNSADLTPGAKGILDRVALSLKQWPEIRVEVAGHTDSKGADAYNLKLSTQRAAAVRAYLTSKGVDGSRMVSRGYGESRPISDNATDAGRKQNRRVELKRLD